MAVPTPIRICFVIGTLDVGGAETQLVELVTRLDRARFEPVIFCLATAGVLAERVRQAGLRVHVFGFRGFKNAGNYLGTLPHIVATFTRFVRAIRAERPHIIHGVLFWAYVLTAFAGRVARVPVVVASRRSLGLFKAHKPHYLMMERVADRLTDLVIANSEAVRLDTIARERLDPRRILVVHNGVDFTRFHTRPASDAGEPGSPRVIVVSNLIHYKGHEYFLRAWPRVVALFPGATALLVGRGVMEAQLKHLASELGITASVQFLGTRTDVPALLASSDLYVHPSLEEGYSNAVLEAMASGRAVVATAVGGNLEAIADGDTGLLVPPADPDALAAAMLALLDDPGRRMQMGARASAAVRARFDIGSVVERYQNIYTRLASGEIPEYDASVSVISRCAV